MNQNFVNVSRCGGVNDTVTLKVSIDDFQCLIELHYAVYSEKKANELYEARQKGEKVDIDYFDRRQFSLSMPPDCVKPLLLMLQKATF